MHHRRGKRGRGYPSGRARGPPAKRPTNHLVGGPTPRTPPGRTSQEDYGWGSVLPSGTAQPDLPLAEVYGPAVILTNHREVPLSEGWILYTYSAPRRQPS